ncbi:MAG: methionyl-tRNA formyltransferase [Dehalococcoidia bacterium]|nr:methionyl-tRNA formyltransferase [Dehalococcoidia bacterium]
MLEWLQQEKSMRLVFMGTPSFAVPALHQLVINNYIPVAVYTKQDKPTGRGREVRFSAVKNAALELGLKVLQPDSLRKTVVQAELAALSPDLIIVAAYGQILPPEVLALPRYGCINIHPSLLPRHRGAAPVVSTILSGDKWSGVSLMQMDERLDTGQIVAQNHVLVRDDDTAGVLSDKLSLISAQMLIDILPRLTKGTIAMRPQNDSQATYFKPLEKEAGEINWAAPAVDIWRQVRAYQPWPSAFTRLNGRIIKVLEATPHENNWAATAGSVMPLGRGCGVITGHGILELRRLQIEGKQAMSCVDFLNGQRSFIGAILPN